MHTCNPTARKRDLRDAGIIFVLVALVLIITMFTGCASQSPAAVNRDITTAIADAGTAATTAQSEYQTATIPQTATNRNLINGLGSGYNIARAAWLAVLNAESVYAQAQNAQLAACTPATSGTAPVTPAVNCTAATQSAVTAKTNLASAQESLQSAVSTLATQTNAVQAITK